MRPNHLHLVVRDPRASLGYYERWFGLELVSEHGDVLFASDRRDEQRFDLALAPASGTPQDPPPGFHFGFRLEREQLVDELPQRMASAGERVAELHTTPGFTWFRCQDPDGYTIEVYWEPLAST